MSDPVVTRCICHGRTFRELKELAEECCWQTVEEITQSTGCGSGCGLCRPYLEFMLKTGITEIGVLSFVHADDF